MEQDQRMYEMLAQHKKDCLTMYAENRGNRLTQTEDFKHGDVVRVVSHERNCGIDQTVFTALIVETKRNGLIVIPQDFQAYIYSQEILKGASWETEVAWLLGNDVEVKLLQRYG